MIEVSHRSIINTLSKMINKEIIIKLNNWITHLLIILLVDRITVKASIRMTPF